MSDKSEKRRWHDPEVDPPAQQEGGDPTWPKQNDSTGKLKKELDRSFGTNSELEPILDTTSPDKT